MKKPAKVAPADPHEPLRLLATPHDDLDMARGDCLDALPIAAAVVRLDAKGKAHIELANKQFLTLVGEMPRATDKLVEDVDFLRASGLGRAITNFLLGEEQALQFQGDDGHVVGGRHFEVGFGRLGRAQGSGLRCLVSLHDITAQVETERSLRGEMLRDSLTGLPNRLGFNERIDALLDDPHFAPDSHAVLVLDMVRFSRVNECVGAIAGDELLITFARRLFGALRAGDVLARTAGDEFGILMKLDRGVDDAIQIARRVESVLAAPFKLSDLEIGVDCAIGCALVKGTEQLSEEVLRNAQFALKRAKTLGQIQIYEPGQARAARHRFSIETELRHAIERGELSLAYQPLIELSTGAVSGFEALARWEHKERGSIQPTEFIPVAEESGLIVELGRWALDSAVRTIRDWDEEIGSKLPISMSVNLSAIQIARDDVAAVVTETLRANAVTGERLTLELTESAIIQDPYRAGRVLEELKGLNARVAMDDFGTGYTSLAYLQRLPIDILKIDRSFVTAMHDDRDSIAIIRAVLSLADALGMETTAEGIDSAELARTLSYLGCTHGQGFYFAPPLNAVEALDYWRVRSA
ncbi:putative bifunctional diguanylate cyclase/phosphodiesterase [Sphingosinicella rhizophila]|uniref:putative bifunctional diguanylate cyclase/phosphodiesterase n=1 Tax=Sphingosinicella rhizophila TaxID=3050082 RepID=UPI0028E27BDE|nr:bifunctional diguanylate cyclase/phosphodiesterase [Sphingosinicella sp. GR2756]